MLRAGKSMADSKHADQPAAKSCSGLVPVPELPGRDSLTSRRPSELRDMPVRPPVVWAFAVYRTFSIRFITFSFMKSSGAWMVCEARSHKRVVIVVRASKATRSGSRDGSSMARTLAAIHVNGLPRDEAGRFQIEDRA